MSANDIQVYSTGDETTGRQGYRCNITAATFVEGEPVAIDGSNEIDICATDPATVLGIAVEPAVSKSSRMAALETADTTRIVDIPAPDKLYMTRNFSTAAAGTDAVPTAALVVGAAGNFIQNAGTLVWSFGTGGGNANLVGVAVLDDDGFNIQDELSPSGAGEWVVFRFA